MSSLESHPGEQPAGSFRSNNRSELIFLRKSCDHFRLSGCVLVYKKNDTPVKLLRSQSLGDYNNGPVGERVAKGEPDQRALMCWYPSKLRKMFLFVPALAASAGEAVSDFDLLGSKVAHQPEPSNPSSCVTSQINNQPVTCLQIMDGKIELTGEVNSNCAGEHRNF